LVIPGGIAEGKALFIEGDHIARIAEADEVTTAPTIELAGLTLFPGFIDAHIHGAVGVDVLAASSEELHLVARFLAREGVTAWLPTFVPASDLDYRRAVDSIVGLIRAQDGRPPGARVVGVHYEGPFVSEL